MGNSERSLPRVLTQPIPGLPKGEPPKDDEIDEDPSKEKSENLLAPDPPPIGPRPQ